MRPLTAIIVIGTGLLGLIIGASWGGLVWGIVGAIAGLVLGAIVAAALGTER